MKHFGNYEPVEEIGFGSFTLTGREHATAKLRNRGGISAHDAIEEQLFDMFEEIVSNLRKEWEEDAARFESLFEE